MTLLPYSDLKHKTDSGTSTLPLKQAGCGKVEFHGPTYCQNVPIAHPCGDPHPHRAQCQTGNAHFIWRNRSELGARYLCVVHRRVSVHRGIPSDSSLRRASPAVSSTRHAIPVTTALASLSIVTRLLSVFPVVTSSTTISTRAPANPPYVKTSLRRACGSANRRLSGRSRSSFQARRYGRLLARATAIVGRIPPTSRPSSKSDGVNLGWLDHASHRVVPVRSSVAGRTSPRIPSSSWTIRVSRVMGTALNRRTRRAL